MDFKENPNLVPNPKNKQLLNSISVAKRILRKETTFQEEFDKHTRALREKNKVLEEETKNNEEETEEDTKGKRKRSFNSQENKEKDVKIVINVQETEKANELEDELKSPVTMKKIKVDTVVVEQEPAIQPCVVDEKVYHMEKFQKYMDANHFERLSDSQSVISESDESEKSQTPSTNTYRLCAKRLTLVRADLVSEAQLDLQHIPHFKILREVISELKSNKLDIMCLLQTDILKDLAYIQHIFEEFMRNKESDPDIYEELKNTVNFLKEEIIKESFDTAGLKKKYEDFLDRK